MQLRPAAGVSVFLGANAQGKSNLLEAIYFLSTGRSFRTNKLGDLIGWHAATASVDAQLEISGVGHRLAAQICKGQRKVVWDGKARRPSAIFGGFKAVIFANEDLDVVRQEPAVRRRFFDLFFAQVDATYAGHLENYKKVLQNRNMLLRRGRFEEIAPWDDLLVREGSRVVWGRVVMLQRFREEASGAHAQLSGGKETLTVSYQSSCSGKSRQESEERLREKLKEHAEHERVLQTTLCGPHRDDYLVEVHAKALKQFGSEGQKRCASLALRMAQWRFLKETGGAPPTILLDDVLGELDEDRQRELLKLVTETGAQTFVALTEIKGALRGLNPEVWQVQGGTLKEGSHAGRS